MPGTTMNISFPDSMKSEVEEIVAIEGYSSTSEFFRVLVSEYLKKRQERELDSVLLNSLKDPDEKEFNIREVRSALAKRLIPEN